MKRFIAFISACALFLICAGTCFAGGLSDEAPYPEPYTGFDDLGGTRAVLFDIDSGAVLYSRRSDVQAKPGSLTVIMTALLLLENTPDSEWDLPIPALRDVNSKWSRRGASMGLAENDTPTRRDLLFGLLLCGAADAAFVTGELVSGSETAFIDAMNARAAELGMKATHFDNGFGLGSNSHYSCAEDMAVLTIEAMRHELFASAVSSESFICSPGCRGIRLSNSNTALASSGCIGIKSGEDSEREHSLILAMQAGEARLGAVVLEAPSETAAYGFADRLISAGLTRYIAAGSLRPYAATNALFTTVGTAALAAEPGGTAAENVGPGECLNVIGYTESDSELYYCVFYRGRTLWAEQKDLAFGCFADDIFIECGEALSREISKGDPVSADAFVSSRHTVRSVKLTLSLFDGTVAAMCEYAPNSHGVCEAAGSSLADELSSLSIPEGLYVCTIEAEVEASIPGVQTSVIKKTGRSMFAVGTGGECVSYNANRGDDAPSGECFFSSFTIPADTPLRAGFEFSHWNTAPDGSGESFHPGDTVEMEGSLTLYAVWNVGKAGWNSEIRFDYDSGLLVEGFIDNGAGISAVKLTVSDGSGKSIELSEECLANRVEPGKLLLTEPLLLDEGRYSLALYAKQAGSTEYELIFSGETDVDAAEAEITPVPSFTAEPEITTAPSPSTDGFNLAGIPIWVWFMAGLIVVIVLISIIITIIKRG